MYGAPPSGYYPPQYPINGNAAGAGVSNTYMAPPIPYAYTQAAPVVSAPPVMFAPPPFSAASSGGFPPSIPSQPPISGMPPMTQNKMPSSALIRMEPEVITTLYVGKISTSVEDEFVRRLLEVCGRVVHWKRVVDAKSSKLKGFGYCDFGNPYGAIRAIKLLNNFPLGGQNLLIKAESAVQKQLDETIIREAVLDGIDGKTPVEELRARMSPDDEKTLLFIHKLNERRESGMDWKSLTIDMIAPQGFESELDKSAIVTREITKFRERQAARELEKNIAREKEEKADEEREQKFRQERERAANRRRDTEEQEYIRREREWEMRERDKQHKEDIDRERLSDVDKRGRERLSRDLHWDDSDRRTRSRDYVRRQRERQRELDEDETDKLMEVEEEKRREEARKREERRREEERRETVHHAPSSHHTIIHHPSPSHTTPKDNTSDAGFFDRTKAVGSIAVQLSGANVEKKKAAIFTNDDQESDELYEQKKKLKLTRLDTNLHHENERKIKVERVKALLDQIPTEKEQVFAYPIDWETIEKENIIENKLRPWVTKKFVEYLGQEEKTLIAYIVNQIKQRTDPKEILRELSMVLDEEGENFVLKMYQMMIFEMLSAKQS
ncbi:hypothetical protein PROFUN_14397 [Planoprotostelium fungivorum]|uniref:RNA-binding protein 25 n=1 Tax=Planoprotostelium fungivorum TaxID=1890364 RepID=A0A2P6N0A1_9EUKA|nr:hypothetical protein PROFUN_14397 [Planoprotostelium fungivorum]